jgi:signal transduction histidine kinase/ActR/RegA family two-component response regulator
MPQSAMTLSTHPSEQGIIPGSDAGLRAHLEFNRSETLKLMLQDAPIGTVLEKIVLDAEEVLPESLCSILLTSPDGAHLTYGVGPHLPAFYNKAVDGAAVAVGNGSCGTAAALGKRVVVEDIATHPYWSAYSDLAQKAELGSCWSQPIFGPRRIVVGTFGIYYKSARSPTPRDIVVIEHASDLAALAIDRYRAQEELARYRDHLEQLVAERAATIVCLNRELQHRVEEAQAANRAKGAFLANMSHELRTPLNAVVGLAALLQESASNPVQIQRTERIVTAGQHLLGTIDAILDLSKIDTGKFTLDDSPLRLDCIVDNVLAMVRDRAEVKDLSLLIDVPKVPFALKGDHVRLQQALLNYVGNAVKFTNQGTVTLRVRVLEDSDESALFRFEVQDTGIGIKPAALGRLFQTFEQADASISRSYGGTGLGLEITRRFAELMGGSAGADSVEGQGSTFWFTARLQKDTKADAPGPHAPPPDLAITDPAALRAILRRDWAGTRILLAEDEPINAEITRALLESVDLTVETAVTGREAVEKAVSTAPALILMDMQMPELDGTDATRAIRALPDMDRLPIIAMTANAFAEDRALCLDAGMNGFLTKPVLPGRLFAEILARLTAAATS